MAHVTKEQMKIALAQYNPIVGDISGNSKIVRRAYKQVSQENVDLIVFSELFLVGYPPEDLVLKSAFINSAKEAIEDLAKITLAKETAILLGLPWRENDKLYNSVALLADGKVETVRHKVNLPNYGVFDEKRVFSSGDMPGPINFNGVRLGVPICEDIWSSDVCECLQETGAEILIVPNGSPFCHGKHDIRMNVVTSRITETKLPLIYVNQYGGQDELVFDGGSFILNSDSKMCIQMPAWQEGISVSDWVKKNGKWSCEQAALSIIEEGLEAIYLAAVTGLRDYVNKNGFPGVVLGLSGGIDSALCAAISVDALGADRVHSVMLPYDYTSDESLIDAEQCAKALGIKYDRVDIHKPVHAFEDCLAEIFHTNREHDVTNENIQSRTRGLILMAISNKFGKMVVTTGNKSEVSVGYATLYGDMNGGYNPIKDIYKTEVYALSRFRNKSLPKGVMGPEGEVIPENIIVKAPSAELRENQKDQDSLPPYEILDDILECFIEKEMPIQKIIRRGHDIEIVKKIEHLLYISEYKRRQAAPGVKISNRNFGRDRRYPITNSFRE